MAFEPARARTGARPPSVILLENHGLIVAAATVDDCLVLQEQVAAVGDEVNDVPMIRHAGLGVAMGNAVEQVKGLAKRITRHHDDHGVAHAIDQMLDGVW